MCIEGKYHFYPFSPVTFLKDGLNPMLCSCQPGWLSHLLPYFGLDTTPSNMFLFFKKNFDMQNFYYGYGLFSGILVDSCAILDRHGLLFLF